LRKLLLPALACLLFAPPAHAQVVELYHPAAPLAAYEVATIKPADADKKRWSAEVDAWLTTR